MSADVKLLELGLRFPRYHSRKKVDVLVAQGNAIWIEKGKSARVIAVSKFFVVPEPKDYTLPSVELPGIRFVPPVSRNTALFPSEYAL